MSIQPSLVLAQSGGRWLPDFTSGIGALADVRRGSGRVGDDAFDPNVWSGRASQEVFVDLSALRSCINVSGLDWSACAPSHHGYQRACGLISRQASNGPFGSPVFARAGKTDPPSRLDLSQTSAGNATMSSLAPVQCSSFVRAVSRSFVPACPTCRAPGAGAVKAGRSWRPPAGLGLDGPEHGARLKRIGMTLQLSACIRSCAPC